ncbi:MAG: hypothetical protein OZSIB_3572 [Candidatus Ozemobacter sibiricus]|jgi:prepilin-type N-terminal cleavage/methylation domain-containing protein|uniref:General secretion pathway GspH domain-containing protein n=1 Tax=Candidatus Ozemobacter sibiricus TaxID=2268124 RepID=A0A367ZPL2_9BACT|nr:MAG: hypothetical protein OZSIB_3572 [Candidatus Ozemobacter sibiricus]
MPNRNYRPPSGFSIVETLMVLLILGILATGGFPLLMGYAQEVHLEQQARMIYQDLCLVRDTAIATGIKTGLILQLGPLGVQYYTMVAPMGVNIRPALMDECENGVWRWLPASHSVQVTLNVPSTSNPMRVLFDGEGRLVEPASQTVRLFVRYSTGTQVLDEPGLWIIELLPDTTSIRIWRGP